MMRRCRGMPKDERAEQSRGEERRESSAEKKMS
jgi:hypothetical protein